MAEYIEREAANAAIMNQRLYYKYGEANTERGAYNMVKRISLLDAIISIPAADVRSVVKGKWIGDNRYVGFPTWACSVCHGDGRGDYHFCPNCGASMEETP